MLRAYDALGSAATMVRNWLLYWLGDPGPLEGGLNAGGTRMGLLLAGNDEAQFEVGYVDDAGWDDE